MLRQYPIKFDWNNQIRFFIADFYCHEAKLVIEIDGCIHQTQKEYDKMRKQIINLLGFRIIRFSNEDILINLNKAIEKLVIIIQRNN
ncbi:MAG: hypothetical protein DRH79_00995 [Candidatus Cloacimonadota bacterium]|nr:MAG: hypothetical protein DRH79_00995 [Candidatus Cloacimonadota bacterium]